MARKVHACASFDVSVAVALDIDVVVVIVVVVVGVVVVDGALVTTHSGWLLDATTVSLPHMHWPPPKSIVTL